jgi:hypothetical protein
MNNKARIAKAWKDGFTSTEIAKMVGVSSRYVFYVVRELNLSKLSPHTTGRPRSEP